MFSLFFADAVIITYGFCVAKLLKIALLRNLKYNILYQLLVNLIELSLYIVTSLRLEVAFDCVDA